ncbi:hypothetical protein [Agrococcus sp. ARC_14]|uniref:hypothetical protein n=1 Tax=Agrococcus sp. ARC_14 TaxID=2919927 RepID=UPI001F055DEB|nr:hypothetical protein [Agrococcus sp. ARC_14]MCH1883294.1 hypothetical protein [Agrococcus sp. ARC_14]
MQDELPETLRREGFALRDALDQGLTRGVLRGADFCTPYRGVRTLEAPTSVLERAQAFAPLLRPWQCFGGPSALALLGLPVPWRLAQDNDVHVVSVIGRGHPERDEVRVRRIATSHFDVWDVEGVRVASPALAWALMGERCTVHELVVIGDALISAFERYPDRRIPGPLATLDDLRAITERWNRMAGAATLRSALPRIRSRVESPRETDMRLLIVDAGMPEPEVQVKVLEPGTNRFLGRADLMHRESGVVEEYEGEGHRSKQQWDRDIQKYRDFDRVGLHVVRATNRDFVPSAEQWLADLADVLRRRAALSQRVPAA